VSACDEEFKVSLRLNRYGYALLTLTGIGVWIVSGRAIEGACFLALAVAFDPFVNAGRSGWQQAWLVIHLAVTVLLFAYGAALDWTG
jgi:hypothetical protein